MTEPAEVLNAQQAAQLLGAHVETIRRLARRGEIPCFKVGKDWRFRRDVLLQWMATHHHMRRQSCVLAIDDDPAVGRLIRRFLEPQGLLVETAPDGREGLARVQSNAVDLVLLDLNMPVMNGPEFIRELRRTHPDLPVVVVTGYPDSSLMMEAYVHGPLMLIPKPIVKKNLVDAVNMVLDGTLVEKESLAN